MKTTRTSLILGLLVIGSILACAPRMEAQGGMPRWEVGNHWTYAGDTIAATTIFNMTMAMFVSGTTSVTVGGSTFPVYDVVIWQNLSFLNAPDDSYINATGHGYYSTVDYSTVKTNLTTSYTMLPFPPMIETNVTTYDPPMRGFVFPLSDGQAWTSASWLNTSIDNGPWASSNLSTDFSVNGPESVTTQAGTFSAFNITQTQTGDTSQWLYSDTVGNYVRFILDFGVPLIVDLLEFSYTPNSPPTKPTIATSPSTVFRGTTVTFTASSTDPDGDTVTYAWEFGDAGTGSGATATHAYAALGTYTVNVTASDGKGGSATNSTTVTVVNRAPGTITHSFLPTAPKTNANITFTASAVDPDSDTITYTWRFGDGDTGTGASVVHAYDTADTYTVNVTANDGHGGLSYTEFDVTVTAPEKPADNTMLYIGIVVVVIVVLVLVAVMAMRGRKKKAAEEPPATPPTP